MPQFEILVTDSTKVIRARNMEIAIQNFFSEEDVAHLKVASEATLEGWRAIFKDGKQIASIREFHRMKFRRD